MATHEIEMIQDGYAHYFANCTACPWISDWSWRLRVGLSPNLHGEPRTEVLDILIDFAEREHLSDPALSGEMVIIAGARLTRRDASFVGKLGDKRVVIQASEHGLWSLYLNDTGIQLIKTWFERVSEVVRASQRYTNDSFA
jgi:hypothetical protein